MQSNILAPWLDKLTKHSALNDSERNALLTLPQRLVAVDSETYLVREGGRAQHCCVLVTGFAYRSRTTAEGARQILAITMRGDGVDLQNSMMRIADHSVQTLTRSEVAYIPHQSILDVIARYPNVGNALWRQTLVDGSVANEWIVNVGSRSGRERIIHLMCEISFLQRASGLTDGPDYEWPLTQVHIAEATGMTNVHVNRIIQGLRRDGLIGLRGQVLTIPDWDNLRKASGFSEAYLHREQIAA